jgi:hypothetical protein
MLHTLGSAPAILGKMPRSVLVNEGAQSSVYGVCGSGRGVVWQRRVFVFDGRVENRVGGRVVENRVGGRVGGRVEKRVGSRVLLAGSTTGELEEDADDDSPEQKASKQTFEWRCIVADHGAGTGN